MNKPFDSYAEQYAKVIAEGARASGETYEYMVELRTRLFYGVTSRVLNQLSNPVILDFGCGTGYTIERLSHWFPNAEFCGYDTSRESLAHAISRNITGASFNLLYAHDSIGASFNLPYTNDSFDAIYSNGTFHHIVEGERATWMKELCRVLKRQGVLVIFENNPLNPLMIQAMRRTPFDRDAEPICSGKLASIMIEAGMQPSAASYYFFFPHALKWLRCLEPLLSRIPIGAQFFIQATK